VKIRSGKESVANFDTTTGGSRISTSFGGTTTGRGASVKIIDDPHKALEAAITAYDDVQNDIANSVTH
jgi:hypothetical protein